MDVVAVVLLVQGYVTYSLPWPVSHRNNGPGKNGPAAGPILDSFTGNMFRSDHSWLT